MASSGPRHVETRFAGYLTLRRFAVAGGLHDVLSGPGHDVVVVTCVTRDASGRVGFVVKQGDTRPARALRGWAYVREGLVAGRLDHPGQGPESIAALEVAEEVGGVVEGAPVRLGDLAVPTMPGASTEADVHLLAAARFDLETRPAGDGGGMEVPELLGVVLREPEEILARVRAGSLGEACRARVAFGRAFEKLGLVPAVPRLGGEEDGTLGLGPRLELDAFLGGARAPARLGEDVGPRPAIDGAALEVLEEVRLGAPSGRFLSARARHTAAGSPVGAPFPVQILDLEEDEVEVLPYRLDPDGVPRVWLERRALPALIAKASLRDEVVSGALTPTDPWAGQVAVAERGGAEAAARALAARAGLGEPELLIRSEASPGQSTLGEHAYGAGAPSTWPGGLRIDDALRRVRADGASARTEALLLELAARA